jgi:hypothetical protein
VLVEGEGEDDCDATVNDSGIHIYAFLHSTWKMKSGTMSQLGKQAQLIQDQEFY